MNAVPPGSARRWSLLLALTTLAALVAAVGLPLRVRVDGPRLGAPWVASPGTTMEIRLASSVPFVLPELQWSLEGEGAGEGASAPLAISARRWDGAEARLTASLPALPDGAYRLRVRSATQDLTMPRAVFLRRAWPSRLRLVQIADLPPPGREPLMLRFVEQMQQQRPDAVLVTGDINYGGSESNIQFIYRQLARLEVPVVVVAGNHEREGWPRYLRVFGERDHRTDLGPLAILSLDSNHGRDALTPGSLRWLRGELAHLDGRTPVIQLHHPVFPPGPGATADAGGTGGYLRGYRREFLGLCAAYHVPIVLSGHWHQDAVFDAAGTYRSDRVDFPGTKFVVTTALGAQVRKVFEQSPAVNGYRWLEFVDGALQSYGADAHNPAVSTALGQP
jgi:hypothetical protein